ncbi:MAG: homoserine O-acetyltransferase [Verrucomicrobiota bacterium]
MTSPPQDSLHKTEFFRWQGPELELENARSLPEFTLAYQTYGQLNAAADNAILLCHALSGDAHVAGHHAEDQRLGWWDTMVGPGKAFDTSRYFVICSNVLGGCMGSTGPASPHPSDGRPYALRFPQVTIADMVRAQKHLVNALGIERLLAVSGGSMGGMQALAWARLFPDAVAGAIPIATAARHSAQSIAWNEIGRRAITGDPNWNGGDYYGEGVPQPEAGLAIARMVGHVTYLSEHSMEEKFGRRWQAEDGPAYTFEPEYAVESYLSYQADKFNQRFDANSYLYITRALDYFDFARWDGSDREAFACTQARFLFIAYSSDWLYPVRQNRELYEEARAAGVPAEFAEVDSSKGHDGFLIHTDDAAGPVSAFLRKLRS